jgi:hypothetical protein
MCSCGAVCENCVGRVAVPRKDDRVPKRRRFNYVNSKTLRALDVVCNHLSMTHLEVWTRLDTVTRAYVALGDIEIESALAHNQRSCFVTPRLDFTLRHCPHGAFSEFNIDYDMAKLYYEKKGFKCDLLTIRNVPLQTYLGKCVLQVILVDKPITTPSKCIVCGLSTDDCTISDLISNEKE